MDPQNIPLNPNEALSGILGSVSIASWVFLLVPQLFENYFAQSAAGISLPFLLIWAAGDVCNLTGALWAQLVPTVIALAIYFCCSDTALILQTLYYNLWVNRHGDPLRHGSSAASEGEARPNGGAYASSSAEDPDEDSPLLSRNYSNRSSDSNIGLPGSHMGRRKSSVGTLGKIIENNATSRRRGFLRAVAINVLAVLGVGIVGTAGWAVAWRLGWWTPAPAPSNGRGDVLRFLTTGEPTPLGAEILGYLSAVAYLGARLPQIYKNYAEKSCEGLSLLFFLLSLLGNLTYGAGILAHSLERQYILTNLPWLIGSLGTMVEDVAIFVQFHIYAKDEGEDGESAII